MTTKELPASVGARLLGINRTSIYYKGTPVSEEELACKEIIDHLHTDNPTWGARLLMLSWDVMIPLCHADMKLPGYLSWNVPFDGAVIRPITEGISSYIHALPAL